MKVSIAISTLLVPTLALAELQTAGYVDLRASHFSGADAWIGGGTGVIGSGDGLQGEARFALDWRGDARWRGRVEFLARAQTADDLGRAGGLLQAFVDYGDLETDQFRWRAGQAFAGSSQENVEQFWQTPFGVSFSTLNSWIGEEFRPIGIDYTKRISSDAGQTDVTAQAFVGNDTGPAVLAWRGFANHQRLSVLGETLPLLPLPSLSASNQFASQRNDGSQPFGPDLDDRIGYLVRAKHRHEHGQLSLTLVDNRGDRLLHDGDEYAWKTRFLIAGFQQRLNDDWTLLGETLHGRTQMGFPPGANVDFAFNASYLTIAREQGLWTQALRIEHFHINERDQSIGELNIQNGNVVALSVLRNQGDWRFGAEVLHGDIARPGNAEFAGNIDQGGTQLQFLLRRYF
jgi:hypothetical protein